MPSLIALVMLVLVLVARPDNSHATGGYFDDWWGKYHSPFWDSFPFFPNSRVYRFTVYPDFRTVHCTVRETFGNKRRGRRSNFPARVEFSARDERGEHERVVAERYGNSWDADGAYYVTEHLTSWDGEGLFPQACAPEMRFYVPPHIEDIYWYRLRL